MRGAPGDRPAAGWMLDEVATAGRENLDADHVVYTFEPEEAAARIEAWCATLPEHPETKGEWTRADIEEHVRDEHSTYAWLLEPMIERCGFRIERADRSADGFFAAYVARAV